MSIRTDQQAAAFQPQTKTSCQKTDPLAQRERICVRVFPHSAQANKAVAAEIADLIRERAAAGRNCVLGLPLKWVLTSHCEIPELPEQDVTSFLQLEAERGFHSDVSTLHFAASRCRIANGKQTALLVGVPRSHLSRIEDDLLAAKLKPLGFGLGITALQPPAADATHGVLAILIGETNVGLEITSGGGVAALRALEAALEMEGSRRILHADLVARETRITPFSSGSRSDSSTRRSNCGSSSRNRTP